MSSAPAFTTALSAGRWGLSRSELLDWPRLANLDAEGLPAGERGDRRTGGPQDLLARTQDLALV